MKTRSASRGGHVLIDMLLHMVEVEPVRPPTLGCACTVPAFVAHIADLRWRRFARFWTAKFGSGVDPVDVFAL